MADSSSTMERFLLGLADLIYEHFGEDGAGEDQSDEDQSDEQEEDLDEDAEDEGTEDEEDEEDEDEEDEDEEDEGYTREELEDMSLRKLRSVAKDEGFSTADLKGKDEDGIIAMILGEDEDEEEDE